MCVPVVFGRFFLYIFYITYTVGRNPLHTTIKFHLHKLSKLSQSQPVEILTNPCNTCFQSKPKPLYILTPQFHYFFSGVVQVSGNSSDLGSDKSCVRNRPGPKVTTLMLRTSRVQPWIFTVWLQLNTTTADVVGALRCVVVVASVLVIYNLLLLVENTACNTRREKKR